MMDTQTQRALAFVAVRIRPRGAKHWDEPGVIAALEKVAHLNAADTAMATLRAAANPKAETPGVIPITTGEHWREKLSPTATPLPPKAAEACLDCGQHLERCACGQHRTRPLGVNPRNHELADMAREALGIPKRVATTEDA